MAEQTIVWTALPNGTTGGGQTLKLSVHVAPRLSASSSGGGGGGGGAGAGGGGGGAVGPAYVPLSQFPDFLDWASRDIRFRVHLGGAPAVTVSPQPGRRPDLWKSLFSASTPVEPYSWDNVWIDPAKTRFRSYPVARVRSFLAGVYGTVAKQAPSEWPSTDVLGRAGLSQVPATGGAYGTLVPGETLEAVQASLDRLYDDRVGAVPPDAKTTTAQDLVLGSTFLAPFVIPPLPRKDLLLPKQALPRQDLASPGRDQASPGRDQAEVVPVHPGRPIGYPVAEVPSFDFHQALSLLANHPPLMRLLGLVLDLEIPRPPGLPSIYEVSVEPLWTPHLHPTTEVSPKTWTAGLDFRPSERPSQPELSAGLVRLGGPDYSVVEVDLDGATLKTLNFTAGIRNAAAHKAADTPSSYALPSLRSAGLSLARSGNAYALGLRLLSANELNDQVTSANPPPTLYAEDVTRGYRIDVWDDHSASWHTLSARVAAPQGSGPSGYQVGNPATLVPVPAGDEGWVQLGTTSSPQSSSSPPTPANQNLPETLFRWAGWSLVAPRPGAHLQDGSTTGLATNDQSSQAPGFPVSISYAAAPGTLPVLRYGRTYRFQARAVDLAGNSIGLRAHGPVAPLTSSPPAAYLRFEPVASPSLLFRSPRTPGEHLELLVVRSNYDEPDSDPNIATCERHVVPPPVAEELAEAHGRFDGPNGLPDPSVYPVLAARASATYNDPAVATAYGGAPDPGTLGQLYFRAEQLGVPYLPDPLGLGAAVVGLPGAAPSPKPVQVPFFDGTSPWPEARSFRLVLRPGQRAPELPDTTNSWGLSVWLPKGLIQQLRLSCYLQPADLAVMGMWSWLAAIPMTPTERAALWELIIWGRHWMFTPYREVTLVHAVRQPLIAPHFGHLLVHRDLAATNATLTDSHVTVDHRSSVRLDVLASWEEPFDDGRSPAGSVELSARSRVGEVTLAYDPVRRATAFGDMRHEFGDTKHRDVYYEAVATTRFLEYFAETSEVTLSGEAAVVVSPTGFAPGATSVTGTGGQSKVIYREGVDYGEDDAQGTIARLAGGAIPDGAQVEVRYVEPPTTRTSLESPVAPAGPKGYLVSVPSSARPAAPAVRYLLPAFGWKSGTTAAGNPYSERLGNTLRVYLGRPWWSSGQGELLGVVLATHLDVGIESQLEPLFSRAGADPLWLTGSVGSGLRLDQFPLAVAQGSGVVLTEQHNQYRGMADVAGHRVNFDPVHGLWFADIEVAVGTSYWPFVRLGLVRYQPASLPLAEVSAVVQTDFAQLAPNRLAGLSFPSATEVAVTVTGPAMTLVAGAPSPLAMKAFIEVQRPVPVSDPDLQWELANPDITSGTSLVPTAAGTDVVWRGTVTLPAARGTRPMRVRLQEAELVPLDTGEALAAELGQRVTYIDTFEI